MDKTFNIFDVVDKKFVNREAILTHKDDQVFFEYAINFVIIADFLIFQQFEYPPIVKIIFKGHDFPKHNEE